ncbi:AAA family ATPase [Calorimonas adulescens]|jgi:CobQ/CobB/MinD/ParA nucleotide binding domain.|uniref:AAA family ATPase n=1 Tax=Calorimonas adulescens TaxID=2606906 RepID=A0A5D8Q9U1_9THEO|nr:carbon monoxide dehydrogenase accessory protein CooC [Calorimonas adulescens]TZE80889.1 AAA family ATPase [Calorimonas adulescens]
MRIAVTGKGGVGKTTLAGVLARTYADDGYKVLAVDADPDPNLASALGFPDEIVEKIVPLSQMRDLIAQRTEAIPGMVGQMFRLNPRVDDIPEKYCVTHNNVKLLVMGTVKEGGSGCTCPEHAFLKALMSHLILKANEVLILDMEAGIEHLGRATAKSVDAFLVVVEPGKRSIQTLKSIKKLARDIGIKNIFAVGNKIKSSDEKAFIIDSCDDIPVIGFLSYDENFIYADRLGVSPYEQSNKNVHEVKMIKEGLESRLKSTL